MNENPKLFVIGYGRCGKDTVSEIICEHTHLTFKSSSEFIGERLIYPKYKSIHNYKNWKECFEDRHNHRSVWYNEIVNYVSDDPSKLAREILNKHDIYCGIRNAFELQHFLIDPAAPKPTSIIWVDRSEHIEPESKESCTVTKDHATHVIDNNQSLINTEVQILNLLDDLKIKTKVQ